MIYRRLLLAGILSLFFPGPTSASIVSGDLFFTTFAGGTNVRRTTFSYDGVSTFSLGGAVSVGQTVGADGIAGNPQNSDLLLVGGQGRRINTISKSTGTAVPYVSPVPVFHLEVADSTTVYGSGIPGSLVRHTINPDGSLSAGTTITLGGIDTTITQLISTPSGFFYTAGGGAFGTLTFSGNSATTFRLRSGLQAAHGGVYDPFTGNIILGGGNHITQLSLAGNTVADLVIGGSFDQGTVDGAGHLYWASNSGSLLFVDYAATGLVNSPTFTNVQFLASALDDVAPLVGAGTTDPTIPEPASLLVWSILVTASMATGWRRRRRTA